MSGATLNETPSGERVHIGFFGIRNAGKSSVVNAVTGQDLAVVSDVRGTTTDPVKKAMELLPIGPVVIIDTPGFDDEGALGEKRVERTRKILAQTDLAILVTDGTVPLQPADRELIQIFEERKLPYLIVRNKADLLPEGTAQSAGPNRAESPGETDPNTLFVSAVTGAGIHELKERMGALAKDAKEEKTILGDLAAAGDTVVLVIPIDASAPKGRIILPQQMVLRELLDRHANALCVQPEDLKKALAGLAQPPALVVTDSQAFKLVMRDTPADIPTTSFSILMARYKGNLRQQVLGIAALKNLGEGDKVLISEGCTHHRQCQDIGTVKIPGWIETCTDGKPEVTFTSGGTFPQDLSPYRLIIHCGACMLNEKEMLHRLRLAEEQNVPMTNYGVAIAEFNGTLRRALEPFPDLLELLDG